MNATGRSEDTLKVIQHIDSMFKAVTGRSPAELAAYGEQLKAAMKEHDSPRKTIDFDDVFGCIDELVAMYSAASAKPAAVAGDASVSAQQHAGGAPASVSSPVASPAPPSPAPLSPEPAQAPRPAWQPDPQQHGGDAGRTGRPQPATSAPAAPASPAPEPEAPAKRRWSMPPRLAIGIAVAVLALVAATGTYLFLSANRPAVGETGAGQTAGEAIVVEEGALFRARQTFIRDYSDALARYLEIAGSYPSASDTFLDAGTTFSEMAASDVAFPVPRAVLGDTIRYVSNGRSYKFILYGTGDCYVAARFAPETVDPARSFGDVDCYAYGAWTSAFRDR